MHMPPSVLSIILTGRNMCGGTEGAQLHGCCTGVECAIETAIISIYNGSSVPSWFTVAVIIYLRFTNNVRQHLRIWQRRNGW